MHEGIKQIFKCHLQVIGLEEELYGKKATLFRWEEIRVLAIMTSCGV